MHTTNVPATIDLAGTVNDVITRHPEAVTVFNSFGIDACCGGMRTLLDAAREDGADASALLAALEWSLVEEEETVA